MGVRNEIRAFAKAVSDMKRNKSKAQSSTARKALIDLAFIEACVNGQDRWIELESMQ